MAECSYARCVQQRRNVRRLLQRWTKNMVHIVGLERIAEELMGRRKWKLYQDSMSRSYLQPLNNNVTRTGSPPAPPGDAPKAVTKLADEEVAASAAAAAATPGDGERGGGPAGGHQKENEAAAEEADRTKDWQPQAKCHFCADGKLDNEHAVHAVLSPRQSDSDTSDSQSDGEAPASLTAAAAAAAAVGNGRAHPRPRVPADVAALAVAALSGGGAGAAAAAAAAAAVAASGGSSHLGFYPPGVPSWYLANVARSFHTAASEVDKAGGEQPLDLSKGSGNSSSSSEPKISVGNSLNVRLPLDARNIFSSDFRAKPRMTAVAGRRTYTEDELQAALHDIQTGKLGTRRAAVIYGIPRSTLRNKVYKLTMERERETHLNSSGLKLDDDDPMDDDKDLSGAEEEKEVEKVLQAPLLSVADILRFPTEHPSEVLRNLMHLRAKEGQEIWTGLDHNEVGPYIQALLASQSLLANQKPEGVVNNILPELAKRMITEEQQLKTQNNGDNEKLSRPSPSNSVITKIEKARSESDMETDESPSNVILKIPSFKPTTSSSKNGCDIFRNVVEPTRLVSPPVTTNTSDSGSPPILPGKGLLIKDAIAQSISQKFQTMESARRPIMEMDIKRGGFTPPLTASMSVIKTQQPPDVQRQQYQPPPKPQQSGTGTTGGKGTRPKRGKYRNYDRDSLVEAVRAVQRGEMSVHRAGSYYGVPHSTLEYKVKERHLMRPRKRDPKPNPVDEKIASLKQNDLRVAAAQQDKMKPNIMKPPQKFSPTSPNGMKLPIFEPSMASLAGYNPAPFPFWPHPSFHPLQMEYAARNPTTPFSPNHEFFASQMMQKMQEDSSRTITPQGVTPNSATLAKNARQMAESLLDGSGANGSFLDGIIRSSLESGIPSSEEKCPREDKNVAPENMSNKALLDQLCRNSRLTPLSKPPLTTTDPNSSGDESYRKGSSPLNFTTSNNSSYQDESEMLTGSRLHKEVKSKDVQTMELSNDSKDTEKISIDAPERKQPRIYLKPDLVKPENLKPEMLVRFQGINGSTECATGSSASDNDAPQD